MKKNRKHLEIIGSILFTIYLVLLAWIILFKLQINLSDIDHTRSTNLMPFHYSTSVGGWFHFKEVRDNVLIFIPLGIFLSMLASQMKLRSKILILVGTSFAFEGLQYILAIGSSDITDIITNSVGGIIGIALYLLLLKAVKNKQKTDMVITIAAGVVTVLFLGLISILLLSN